MHYDPTAECWYILHFTTILFIGNLSDVEVNLDGNSLTRFDESVFRPILEQMVSGRGKIQFQRGSKEL